MSVIGCYQPGLKSFNCCIYVMIVYFFSALKTLNFKNAATSYKPIYYHLGDRYSGGIIWR